MQASKEHASIARVRPIWNGSESMQKVIESAPLVETLRRQRGFFGLKQRLLLLRQQFEAKEAEG